MRTTFSGVPDSTAAQRGAPADHFEQAFPYCGGSGGRALGAVSPVLWLDADFFPDFLWERSGAESRTEGES